MDSLRRTHVKLKISQPIFDNRNSSTKFGHHNEDSFFVIWITLGVPTRSAKLRS
ncbi:hypothetical protein LMANV2_390013 [Leptospira interrogans serovar Manilae]|uniref:Uncharacterized protein n=1 Tax=Leptospira interrogans serovar Manilae TaxID=214675 RepID=A0AAQ1SP15_LEPIR|nr:hypothetical protein LMANV2_390013 [Leptospira interrogans serovar Manilae]